MKLKGQRRAESGGNYVDMETGESFWVSGVKKNGEDRRWAGSGKVLTRMNRWSKNGVLDQVFEQLQREQIVRIRIEAVSLDSTTVKVHPDGTGALKKTDRKPSASRAADGLPRFIWLPQMRERR
jgi:lactam utilization protein B